MFYALTFSHTLTIRFLSKEPNNEGPKLELAVTLTIFLKNFLYNEQQINLTASRNLTTHTIVD